jgi:hypothetical protein
MRKFSVNVTPMAVSTSPRIENRDFCSSIGQSDRDPGDILDKPFIAYLDINLHSKFFCTVDRATFPTVSR